MGHEESLRSNNKNIQSVLTEASVDQDTGSAGSEGCISRESVDSQTWSQLHYIMGNKSSLASVCFN